ncbi:MAG TPA: 2-succinyl-5-enolpyruvyl-6-hydroxy-3-cyclohexene-1-carboxylic-acid synthase [Acidimicrobiales bacterium]|nr:2-succinyl-5-enolpyruvyl-6-hydroxy-3-cyclohexene-1-carboxylic-acid synthase [Acidimicrobiales bacterium]
MSVQATFSATLVDEWARLGVTDAVVCPGSRSTPLVVPLAQRLRTHIRLDERSAAFYALGLAKATRRPVIVCVTSGTAGAELHPAVVEAHHARVPLIVCTADRPPELHHTGASQTIEQDSLFSVEARWRSDPGVPAAGQEEAWRPLAARAVAESLHHPSGPGPVHLNLAFREPLTEDPGELPPAAEAGATVGGPLADIGTSNPLEGRGIVVAGGPSFGDADPEKVLDFAARLGWPVLGDPLSGCRIGGTVAAADAIVRTQPPLPDVVVQLGAPWLSKALGEYMAKAAAAGSRIVVVDPWRQRPDPQRIATELVHADANTWLSAAAAQGAPADPDWLASWRSMEDRAQRALDEVLLSQLSEPAVARILHGYAAASEATLVVSASMPIRDLEWFAPALPVPPRVLANRGANGIDGVVSTALGAAASGTTGRTLALLGDLAFLHDVSGLVNLPEVPCTFVVVDNGGGGIFSFLPQAKALRLESFETLFATPPTSDLGAVARGFGLPVEEVTTLSELEPALAAAPSAPAVVRVRVPSRAENVARHDEINQAVRRALSP